jgi:hypothetical protein
MKSTRTLSMAMVVVGLFLIFGLPFAFDLWPAGFRWGNPAGHAPYERMIVAIYAALGICLLIAARDPARHAIIIDFTIISSVLHGGVMLYDAIVQPGEHTHLVADVPLLFAVAAFFAWLHPRRLPTAATPLAG